MLEPLYTAAEMRAAEERYPGFPTTAAELMERAGAAVAVEVMRAYPEARRIAVVCGNGSNGGDGRIAAGVLRKAGLLVDETEEPEGYDLVVDALFGTGFCGVPRSEAAILIDRINAVGAPVVSVDVPSGVDASTGEVAGVAVEAELTVTFHGPKLGLVVAPGRFLAGKVVVADIGLTQAPTRARRVTAAILDTVPARGPDDTKFSAGRVVVVGGSAGLTGAPVLSSQAALRADAGHVTLCVPQSCLAAVECLALEPVKVGLPEPGALERVLELAKLAGALAIGPGLGRAPAARALVKGVLAGATCPVVVDADGLFGLEPVERSAPTILTPHAGELARLLDVEADWVSAHRLEAVAACAERFGAVTLLKGADTLVQVPGLGVLVCDYGRPSLATAGTGDVLTGIVAAFLAKGMEPGHAAAAAAVAHGRASALCAPRGLVASDLLAVLPRVLPA
jgi:ADP-dependent NAD(P)H-hydrate dehydratase / NAD(P)H-hydrate epimerase